MAHVIVPEAEAILDQPFPVLDKGFLTLVDFMGGDQRVVDSARVSYQGGTKTVRENRGLINYLMANDHGTPFEKVRFEFHVKAPLFVARQWFRHRMGSFNEISGRYSVLEDEFYVPDPSRVKTQSKANKQGSGDAVDEVTAYEFVARIQEAQNEAYDDYTAWLEQDIARELARINLPLSTYTQWCWTVDLRNLLGFIRLRLDSHAQWEIAEYGKVLAQCAKAVAPLCYEAFEEHVQQGVRLSRSEVMAVRVMLERKDPAKAEGYGAPGYVLDEKKVDALWKKLGLP